MKFTPSLCILPRTEFYSVKKKFLTSTHRNFVVIVQALSRFQFSATPWIAACQASLSFTISWSFRKLMSIESVMPSNHLILCSRLLLLPSIFPSIRVFSNESVLHIRWPEYWSFSFSISPSNEYSGLIFLGLTCLISLLTKELSRVFSNTIVQKHQFFLGELNKENIYKDINRV